jgi:hypothetical protein
MLWALDADVADPMSRVILINLANYAGEGGRGAWPSQATLERRASCSERSVRRKLLELEAAGLIRRGDQRMVAHLAGNRRPVVWDLNLSGEAWGDSVTPQESTPKPVENPPETGDNPVDAGTSGGTPETVRGDTGGRQTVLDPKDPPTPKPATPAAERPAEPPAEPSPAAPAPSSCRLHRTPARRCRACGTSPRGQADDEHQAAVAARRRAIAACPDCDPAGWLEDGSGRVRRCEHVALRAAADVVS